MFQFFSMLVYECSSRHSFVVETNIVLLEWKRNSFVKLWSSRKNSSINFTIERLIQRVVLLLECTFKNFLGRYLLLSEDCDNFATFDDRNTSDFEGLTFSVRTEKRAEVIPSWTWFVMLFGFNIHAHLSLLPLLLLDFNIFCSLISIS